MISKMLFSLVLFLFAIVRAEDCTICPDGSDVGLPDRIIPFLNIDESRTSPTCLEFDTFTRTASLSDCQIAHDQAGYCGCEGADPVDACKICGDNEVGVPDKVTIQGDTCADIADYTRYLTETDCGNTRGQNFLAYDAVCQCPGVEPNCSICPDGVTEVPEPDLEVFDGKCGEIFEKFLLFSESACESNDRLAVVNGVRCGCRDKSEFPACTIRQNEDKCTKELLDTVDQSCECYNFCGDKFLGCDDFPGKTLSADEMCPGGTLISGCNYAGATTADPSGAVGLSASRGVMGIMILSLGSVMELYL